MIASLRKSVCDRAARWSGSVLSTPAMSNDSAPGRLAGTSTVPANRNHLEGDFSDLLLLPSGAGANTPAGHHQYQIFDPLTTRPDPARPGRVIRTPFPGNIIPRDRFMNPDGTYRTHFAHTTNVDAMADRLAKLL